MNVAVCTAYISSFLSFKNQGEAVMKSLVFVISTLLVCVVNAQTPVGDKPIQSEKIAYVLLTISHVTADRKIAVDMIIRERGPGVGVLPYTEILPLCEDSQTIKAEETILQNARTAIELGRTEPRVRNAEVGINFKGRRCVTSVKPIINAEFLTQ